MTDKEIIIDMRKCEHFGIRTSNGKQFGWCHYYDEHCKDYPNCYFKQLKRKEQECEELKREIAFGNNGKLSDKIRAIVFKDLNNENSKYKQALDEIENIADDYNRVEKTPQYYRDGFDQIQDIINAIKENINY